MHSSRHNEWRWTMFCSLLGFSLSQQTEGWTDQLLSHNLSLRVDRIGSALAKRASKEEALTPTSKEQCLVPGTSRRYRHRPEENRSIARGNASRSSEGGGSNLRTCATRSLATTTADSRSCTSTTCTRKLALPTRDINNPCPVGVYVSLSKIDRAFFIFFCLSSSCTLHHSPHNACGVALLQDRPLPRATGGLFASPLGDEASWGSFAARRLGCIGCR